MVDPWDEDDFDLIADDEAESENPYLADTEMGLELIRRLLTRKKNNTSAVDKICEIIDEHIMPLVHELDESQSSIVETLIRVKIQIAELHKVGILQHRAILGVGGKFSAGKSCFINSLTKAGLPEGQRATTSIATYIVKSDFQKKQAITANDLSISLDDNAIEALSHEFSRLYGIGFVRIIDNLIIHSPTFRYPEIAILDTPGYSKSDMGKNADATDAEIALRQLRSADAIVWLMDIENGVINESDLKFIEDLKTNAKILFVFNKSDLRPNDTVAQIVNETRSIIQSHPNLENRIFEVIAYSSTNGTTIIGDDALGRFLLEVSNLATSKLSLYDVIDKVQKEAKMDITKRIKAFKDFEKKCTQIISKIHSPERISSIIGKIAEIRERKWRLNKVDKEIEKVFNELKNNVSKLINKHNDTYYVIYVKIPLSWKLCKLQAFNKTHSEEIFTEQHEIIMILRQGEWYVESIPIWANTIILSSKSDSTLRTEEISINFKNSWIVVHEDSSYEIINKDPES